jgi:hypothetical protein
MPLPLPTLTLNAGFGSTGQTLNWVDISNRLRSGSVNRSSTREQGPMWQYAAGTAQAILRNETGDLDSENVDSAYYPNTAAAFSTQQMVNVFTAPGTASWDTPTNMIGNTVVVECWGAGGGGGGGPAGSGGGGGEYSKDPAVVVSGTKSLTVGTAGTAGANNGEGGTGGNTTFTGNSVTVTAHGGTGGNHTHTPGGSGGSGSTNPTHYNGGNGGLGANALPYIYACAGGGGGGSGGSGSAGNTGSNGTGSMGNNGRGGAGATAVTGGGPGGKGGGNGQGSPGSAGVAPTSGPGGGGGGADDEKMIAGPGYAGKVKITYTILVQDSSGPPVEHVETYTTPGTATFNAPSDLTGTAIVEVWAGGGAGHDGSGTIGGGGGAGGEYASDSALALTASGAYSYTIGIAGVPGATRQGGDSTFAGDSVTVTAHGGAGGYAAGNGNSPGGNGSTNETHYNGGNGGSGASVMRGAGAGGGAGSAGVGTAGTNNGTSPPAGGAGGTPDGGIGGTGSYNSMDAGAGTAPGGGGGGGYASGGQVSGAYGGAGMMRITYYTEGVTAEAHPVSQIHAMVPVTLTATYAGVTYPLFYGYADSWMPAGINNPRYDELELSATDGFKVLAGIQLPEVGSPVGAGETSGSRVTRLLDASGWPSDLRAVDSGDVAVQGITFGSSALDLMQVTADTEIGELYQDGSGNIVFRSRSGITTDDRSTVAQTCLGDRPGTVHPSGSQWTSQGNNAEGLSNAQTVSTSNSGGNSGQAFAAVNTSGSGTVTGSTAQAAHGTKSIKCTTTASTSTANVQYSLGAIPRLQAYARMYGYLSGSPAATERIIQFADVSNNSLSGVFLSTSRVLTLRDSAGTVKATFVTTVPSAAWFRLEVWSTFPGDATGFASVRLFTGSAVDDTIATETQTVTAQTFGAAGANHVHFGWSASVASNQTLYLDDIDVNWMNWSGPAVNSALTELPYTSISRANDDTTLANDIQITRVGGTLQEAQNNTSESVYLFPRSYARTDLLYQTDGDALTAAAWILSISLQIEDRIDSIVINPLRDPVNLWPQVLGREIGDRVQIWRRPAGIAVPIMREAFIRSIQHTFDASAHTWQTEWGLQPADLYT